MKHNICNDFKIESNWDLTKFFLNIDNPMPSEVRSKIMVEVSTKNHGCNFYMKKSLIYDQDKYAWRSIINIFYFTFEVIFIRKLPKNLIKYANELKWKFWDENH